MKYLFKVFQRIIISCVIFLYPLISMGQGLNCSTADPFCTGTTYNFPAATSVPDIGTYQCLTTTPNAAWYFLQIAQPGNLDIYMESITPAGSGVDIDFACWGPFTSVAAGCTTDLQNTTTASCSYSMAATETCNITNAQAGDIYILLITNYSDQVTNIEFSQTGGTGTTDCSILAPPITNNGPLCVGQSLNLIVTNPTTGATYNWTGPNGFISSQTNPSIPSVTTASTGTYSLTITVGGVTSAPVTTSVVVNTNPIAIAGIDQTICSGQIATLNASGGTSYQWTGSGTTQSITVAPVTTTTYTVTVSTNGCTGTDNVIVNVTSQPAVSVSAINPSCGSSNGSVSAIATGTCNPGFTYQWNTTPPQNSQNVSNLPAGNYTVTVSCNGCTATATSTIINPNGPTVTINNPIDATCWQSNGSAIASASSGTLPYSYNWNSTPPQYSATLSNVSAGNYTVQVIDANGCSVSENVAIGQIGGPTVTASTTNELCGKSNATATVIASGGTGQYTYLWNNGQTSVTVTNLSAGSYTVTVDDGACAITTTAFVANTPGPVAGFSIHPKIITTMDGPVSFQDNSSGIITNWQWNMGDGSTQTEESFEHAYENIGTYLVTLIVTADNGCMDTVQDTIMVKEIFTLYIPNVFSPNGDGLNDLFVPYGLSVDPDNFSMQIFDRWGNMVFSTDKWLVNNAEGWNGTKNNTGTYADASMEVYVYRIKVKELLGRNHEYFGRIAIIP